MGEKGLVKKWDMKKYQGPIRLIEKEFKRKFKDGSFVFVQDMSDLFTETVPREYIVKVLEYIKKFPNTTFLLLTKNPDRYRYFAWRYLSRAPHNIICGCTVESDICYPEITKAPDPRYRLNYMTTLDVPRKMISIEPIMDFNLDLFVYTIWLINPEFVYIGFDNHNNDLPEPSIEKVDKLITELKKFTEVREKPSVEKRRKQQ